jgi:hypothetical protein
MNEQHAFGYFFIFPLQPCNLFLHASNLGLLSFLILLVCEAQVGVQTNWMTQANKSNLPISACRCDGF